MGPQTAFRFLRGHEREIREETPTTYRLAHADGPSYLSLSDQTVLFLILASI
jgi:hypothetical protein